MSDYQLQEEKETWENIARTDPSEVVAEFDRHTATQGHPGLDQRDQILATEKQVSYMEGLRDGKDLTSLKPEQVAWLRDADFKAVTKKRASDVIGQLKDLPWLPRDAANLPDVKDGRYAIPKEDGTLMFYSIKQGQKVTWVDVWASDARWPVKDSAERWRILNAIKDDPDAGPRFGREIGRCYVCGRTLTDETSRAFGIGPVCRDS